MTSSRVEALVEMAQTQPDNELVWYGLANEYVKLERWAEAAAALERVVRLSPDYTAAYQLLGTALARQGDLGGACRVWTEGVAVATRTGAWKARQHMESLLTGAENSSPSFCQGASDGMNGAA